MGNWLEVDVDVDDEVADGDTLNNHLHPPARCNLTIDEIVIVLEWHEGRVAEVGRRYSYSGNELEWFSCMDVLVAA